VSKGLTVALIIASLCIGYYFAVALPEHNRAVLQLEMEKFQKLEEEKKEKKEERQRIKDAAAEALTDCKVAAEREFNSTLKLNGTPVPGKPGVFHGSNAAFNSAGDVQAKANAACQRQYELDLKAAED
jgi:hypothetical protein